MDSNKLMNLLDAITDTLGQQAEAIDEVATVVDHMRHARTAAIEQRTADVERGHEPADSKEQPPGPIERLHW